MKILAAALPLRIKARLVGRMKQAEVVVLATAAEVQQALSLGGCDLLVLHEDLPGGAVEALREARRSYRGPVLFCASSNHTAEFLGELQRLRVAAVFSTPIDSDELVRRAAIELTVKVPDPEPSSPSATSSGSIPAALLAVWKKHEATNQTRVATLFEACDIGLTKLSEEEREISLRAAHQLAGTLGTFGLVNATLQSREAENLLRHAAEATPAQEQRLRQIAHSLELQIADPSVKLSKEASTGQKGTVLILAGDEQEGESLVETTSAAGWQALATTDGSGARKLVALENPRAMVIDLTGPNFQEALVLLNHLTSDAFSVRIVALIPSQDWQNLPSCTPLVKPFSSEQLIQALDAARPVSLDSKTKIAKILAVDDDPIVLESVTAMLASFQVEVHTLADPLAFWDTLQKVSPDMLLLDVDLPLLSGLEICRAVRSDPTYRGLPILFLSAYSDADTVHRVFQAGGDDYIYKPVVGPELLTRVANRLERSRSLQKDEQQSQKSAKSLGRIGLVVPEHGTAALVSGLIESGFEVERYQEKGEELIKRLTCAKQDRPAVLLLGQKDSLELLQRLDGLGVTSGTEVWIWGPFYEEAAVEVFERGGAGFFPDGISLPRLVKRLERALGGTPSFPVNNKNSE